MSTVKVNTVDKRTGSTLTLGGCGTTVTLPATPSAGDIISIKDYARTAATNNINFCRNGSKMDGFCASGSITTDGESTTLIYVDGTQGWTSILDNTTNQYGAAYITATGGTISCSPCGDYKIHTFTSDGCFSISAVGNPAGSDSVDYIVVAGVGGSASDRGGGGGAGGYREGYNPGSYTASPLATSALPVSVQTYPIIVGGGGSTGSGADGNSGSNSVFSTITSTGGGGGGRSPGTFAAGLPGGSGGGSGSVAPHPNGAIGGTGNTPPVSPPQGNGGGTAGNTPSGYTTGGGGGAGAVGGNGTTPTGGSAGDGVNTSISGSSVGYSGGGAGASDLPGSQGTPAGPFGGGTAATEDAGTPGTAGTANTGGGGGGSAGSTNGGAGGSGIVIIRYKFQ